MLGWLQLTSFLIENDFFIIYSNSNYSFSSSNSSQILSTSLPSKFTSFLSLIIKPTGIQKLIIKQNKITQSQTSQIRTKQTNKPKIKSQRKSTRNTNRHVSRDTHIHTHSDETLAGLDLCRSCECCHRL